MVENVEKEVSRPSGEELIHEVNIHQLINAFSSFDLSEHVLTADNAGKFNTAFGGKLVDVVKITALLLPPQHVIQAAGYAGGIDIRIKNAYNRVLYSLRRAGYEDVGTLRNADPNQLQEMLKVYGVGQRQFLFASIGFKLLPGIPARA